MRPFFFWRKTGDQPVRRLAAVALAKAEALAYEDFHQWAKVGC
jgi:hypothetical protein